MELHDFSSMFSVHEIYFPSNPIDVLASFENGLACVHSVEIELSDDVSKVLPLLQC